MFSCECVTTVAKALKEMSLAKFMPWRSSQNKVAQKDKIGDLEGACGRSPLKEAALSEGEHSTFPWELKATATSVEMSSLESLTTLSALASPAMSEAEDIQECPESTASTELLMAADLTFSPMIETLEFEPEPAASSSKSAPLQFLIERSKRMLSSEEGLSGSPSRASSWEFPMTLQEKRDRVILIYDRELHLTEVRKEAALIKMEAMQREVARLCEEQRYLKAKAQQYKVQLEQQSRVEEQVHQLLLAKKRPPTLRRKMLQRKVQRRAQRLRAEGRQSKKLQHSQDGHASRLSRAFSIGL